MKKYFAILFFCFALSVHADTDILGPILSSTTWSSANGTYIIHGNVTVPVDVTLTIEPGVVLKFQPGGGGVLTINGSLVIKGTAENRVYFTSLYDDSLGGDTNSDATSTTPAIKDWQGIYFNQGSSGDLDYTTVQYGGYGGSGYGDFVGIENNGGDIKINHSIIDQNNQKGVWQKNGTTTIDNSVISNHLYFGVMSENGTTTISNTSIQNNAQSGVYYSGANLFTLSDNNFSGNAKTAFINAGADFVHSGNTSTDITNRGFETSGTPKNNSSWNSQDLPLIVFNGSISVPIDNTLNIEPGTIIKLGNIYGNGMINVDGNLVAHGTNQAKIYFTSLKDDSVGGDTNGDGNTSTPAPMDWQALVFGPSSNVDFQDVSVSYGGASISLPGLGETIYNSGTFNAGSSFFGHNFSSGVFMDSGTTTISHSEFTAQPYGVRYRGGVLSLSNNNFHGNTIFGVLRESGQTVEAQNNWWGSDTGPNDVGTSTPTGSGDKVVENIIYDPWLKRDPLLPPPRNPVIIVPGIMGSTLINPDIFQDELWPNIPVMLLPGPDDYLNNIDLNELGETKLAVSSKTIIKGLSGFDFFNGLFSSLISTGFVEEKDLFGNSYDWRLDIPITADKLKEKINQVRLQTGATKVDLIAHSMGGLVVKSYIKNFGGESVGTFVDIATPHTGSPKAFKILNYGDNFGFEKFGFEILNSNKIKTISQNMPSVYELLPSQKYFDDTNSSYKYYVFDGVNNNERLTFGKTQNYLKNAGRNSILIDKADTFHQEVDDLSPADYGVKTYNIVGCGIPTAGQYYILDKKPDGSYVYNIRMINGDGTVPLKSAEAIPSFKTYFVKNVDHSVMPSSSGVKELITSILNGNENPDISVYSNIIENETNCPMADGKMVSFHSPISLDVYDSSGNHTGLNANGDIENNIPGVRYETIEDNKFAFLPYGADYNVVGKATENGSFDARIETLSDGEITNTTLFNDISILVDSQTKFIVGSTTPKEIMLDKNGDNIFESAVSLSKDASGFLESTGKDKTIKTVNEELKQTPILVGSSRRDVTNILLRTVAQKSNTSSTATSSKVYSPELNNNKIKLESPEVYGATTNTGLNNTAVVYKSFTQNIKKILKTLWGRFKSKL